MDTLVETCAFCGGLASFACKDRGTAEMMAEAGTIPCVGYRYAKPEYKPNTYYEPKPPETTAPLTGGSSEYYKLPVGATDLLDLIEHKFMSFGVGNIFKACYRLGEKSGTSKKYDLEKIIFFAQRELDRDNSGAYG